MSDPLRVCCKPCDHGPMSNIMSRIMFLEGDGRDLMFYVFDDGPAAIAIGDAPRQVYSRHLARSLSGRRSVSSFDPFDVHDYELMWAGLPDRAPRPWTMNTFGLEFGTTNPPPRPFRNARRRR